MFARADVSDDQLRFLRRIGFGLLLAAVFIPFDLLAIVGFLGAGVYLCLRIVQNQRNLASIRMEG